jgi:hypothetical protein
MKNIFIALSFVSILFSCQKEETKTTNTAPSNKTGIIGQWEVSYYIPVVKQTFIDTITFDSTSYRHSINLLKNERYAYTLKNANLIEFEAHKYDMFVGKNREITSALNFITNDKMVIDKFGEESDIATNCPDHSCRTDVTFKRIY